MRLVRPLLALAALAASVPSLAGSLLFSQQPDNWSQFGPSQLSLTGSSANGEAGDDFDLKASIDRVVVRGERQNYFSTTLPPIGGAWVRFYAWNNGLPGAKQYELWVPSGANLSVSPSMSLVDVKLATPFSASGKHFVTVQLNTDEAWYWQTSNSGGISGGMGAFRDNLTGGVWVSQQSFGKQEDGSYDLYGTLTGGPSVSSVSDPTIERSGRLRILGSNFGQTQGSVMIDGLSAIVTSWTAGQITAYVPEQARIGADSLQVVTASGTSPSLSLNVTARSSTARIRWRFKVDAPYTSGNAALGPDGTVYVCDTYGRVYAVDSNGGLKWIAKNAGFFCSLISIGTDGTIYVGNDGGVTALNPNGTQKWRFVDTSNGWLLAGPNVGPDGNIYLATSSIKGGHGIMSLTPAGVIRWSYAPVNEFGPTNQNMSFGGGHVYVGFDQYTVDPQAATFGLTLNGSLVFKAVGPGGDNIDTGANPAGDVYAASWSKDLFAYSSTGTLKWNAFGAGNEITAPRVGPDGTIYVVRNLGHVYALNPDGSVKWNYNDETIHDTPRADPQNTILVGDGKLTYGAEGYIEAFSKAGSLLWREIIPNENPSADYPGNIIPQYGPTFTPDGATAYFGSTHIGQNSTNEYTYLYAVKVKDAAAAPADNASVASQTVPSSMTAGQTYSVVVNVTNTGQTTWTAAGGYQLVCLEGSAWGKASVALGSSDSVAPGQTKKFSFSVYAPTTGGTYPMQWRMAKGAAQFGSATSNVSVPVAVRQHAARYLSQSLPTSVKAGSTFTMTVKMRNVGSLAWTQAGGFSLCATDPDMSAAWGTVSVPLVAGESVGQGVDKTFTFTCKAPTTAGSYTIRWRMYRKASAFTGMFGDKTTTKTITITP